MHHQNHVTDRQYHLINWQSGLRLLGKAPNPVPIVYPDPEWFGEDRIYPGQVLARGHYVLAPRQSSQKSGSTRQNGHSDAPARSKRAKIAHYGQSRRNFASPYSAHPRLHGQRVDGLNHGQAPPLRQYPHSAPGREPSCGQSGQPPENGSGGCENNPPHDIKRLAFYVSGGERLQNG